MENELIIKADLTDRLCEKNGWDIPEDREIARDEVDWFIVQLKELGVIK